jgi:4-amino-4-deoxy-L-arabinose transferase-like glycosyltransferase
MKDKDWESLLYQYRYIFCFGALGIVYFLNMFPDVMEADASQYAAISWEMLENGSYLQVFQRGLDYLDKPPLLFWLSSFSFKLFGVSNFTYKLPAVLVILMGIYATYRFTLHWYDKQRAYVAALVLASTQALLLITNDVRTDGILMGFVMLSVWQLSLFLDKGKLLPLVLGSVVAALALMAKGPLGLAIVCFAIGSHLLLKKQFKAIFKPQWLLMILIIAVMLIPMCYGLYQQFDLHPEKEVYGLKGPSGLRFFFWTQSFGRITGEIYWKNNTGYLYFINTILWDFQPWILFLFPALARNVRNLFMALFMNGTRSSPEYFTLGGFLLSFAALSASSYKLPHYIFPLFPFIAVITADFIVWLCKEGQERIVIRSFRILSKVHFGLMNLFFLIPLLSFIFFFPVLSLFLPVALVILFLLFWYSFVSIQNKVDKIMIPTILTIMAFGLVLSTYFYPSLLKYQSESVVGKEIHEQNVPLDKFYFYKAPGSSMDFYARRIVPEFKPEQIDRYGKGTLVFTTEEGRKEIMDNKKTEFKVLKSYDDFHVSSLKITFLREDTRYKAVTKNYLLEKQ